jgi:hypothetical protein
VAILDPNHEDAMPSGNPVPNAIQDVQERRSWKQKMSSHIWPWSKKKIPPTSVPTATVPPVQSQSSLIQFLDPWDPSIPTAFDLDSILAESKGFLSSPPLLPLFPYPDPDPPVLLKHELGDSHKSVVVLEVSCSRLKSPSDTPNIIAVIKCITSAPARVSSIAISFSVEGNQIIDISPEEHLGEKTWMESNTKSNSMAGLHAGLTLKGLSLGAQIGKDKGVEKSGMQVTQMSIKGILIGPREARWVLTDDPNNTASGSSGLPRQTELTMRMRFRPRAIFCSYTITAVREDGSTTVFDLNKELTLSS